MGPGAAPGEAAGWESREAASWESSGCAVGLWCQLGTQVSDVGKRGAAEPPRGEGVGRGRQRDSG